MKELTNEEILLRAREARIKKLSQPKSVLAKKPTMMGALRDLETKQKEAKG